jgi:glycerol uptake facilitator-like aquaporin
MFSIVSFIHEFVACSIFMSASFCSQTSISFAIASYLAILYGSFSNAGHFNPIVTVYCYLQKKVNFTELISLISAQLFTSFLFGIIHYFNNSLRSSSAFTLESIILEFVFTAALLEAVHCLTLSNDNRIFVPITLFIAHEILVPITGCNLNPIRYFFDSLYHPSLESIFINICLPWLPIPIVYAWSKYIDNIPSDDSSHNIQDAAL